MSQHDQWTGRSTSRVLVNAAAPPFLGGTDVAPSHRARLLLGARGDTPARWGLALVEGVIGYVWLLSALNKWLNPHFRPSLAHMLQGQVQDNPNHWWVAFIRWLVLPHAPFWAALIQVGELLVALGYFGGVALWLSGWFPHAPWARRANWGVLLALLGGALMTANYYLMNGETVPGLNPSGAYAEGLSIDGLVTLLALALFAVHLLALRARSARDSGRRELQHGARI